MKSSLELDGRVAVFAPSFGFSLEQLVAFETRSPAPPHHVNSVVLETSSVTLPFASQDGNQKPPGTRHAIVPSTILPERLTQLDGLAIEHPLQKAGARFAEHLA
jgi:hypothetical protein